MCVLYAPFHHICFIIPLYKSGRIVVTTFHNFTTIPQFHSKKKFDGIIILIINFFALNFLPISSCRISSTVCCTMSLTSFSPKQILVVVGSCLISLNGLPTAYFIPKSSSNFHCSEKCPGPWIKNVSFDLSLGQFIYLWLQLPERSLIIG